jgi:hypothetical protein
MSHKLSQQRNEIKRRRLKVAMMYTEGLTLGQIADKLEVAEGTITKDMRDIRAYWLEKASLEMSERKAEELAKLDRVESEAWAAWQRSKESKTTISEKFEDMRAPEPDDEEYRAKKRKGGKPVYVPFKKITEKKTGERDGDPRYLEVIERCVTMRLRVLGMLKSDNTINNNIQINWGDMFGEPEPEVDVLTEKVAKLPKRASEIIEIEVTDTKKKEKIEVSNDTQDDS